MYHFFNEIIIGCFHAVILISLINGTSHDSKLLAKICFILITTAWALNIIVSLFNTIKAIIEKIKGFFEKKRSNVVQDKYINKTIDEGNNGDIKTFELN